MSCSKFSTYAYLDLLHFFDRDQLERISITCRLLNRLVERGLQSKSLRVFDKLEIRPSPKGKSFQTLLTNAFCIGSLGAFYRLRHNGVQLYPKSGVAVQQFLAGENTENSNPVSYSFVEISPYLGPTVRFKETEIKVRNYCPYTSEAANELESLTHLWRDRVITIKPMEMQVIFAESIRHILDSPTILKCKQLEIEDPDLPLSNYPVLYSADVFHVFCNRILKPENWKFFEGSRADGGKPLFFLTLWINHSDVEPVVITNYKYQVFPQADSPCAFKMVVKLRLVGELLPFSIQNTSTQEVLELKEDYSDVSLDISLVDVMWEQLFDNFSTYYTLERSIVSNIGQERK
ncbi:hypothetical protein Ddc_12232 [Ditylenchus destructor]|nr:hypothetical protein Ddc_12232 [Ditylenchus destructor]